MTDTTDITYIELDDPTPRWYRWAAGVMTVLSVIVFVTPFLLDLTPPEDAAATDRPLSAADFQTSTNICQPSVDFPDFARPALNVAMPSWMRVCEWFSDDPSNNGDEIVPISPGSGPGPTE